MNINRAAAIDRIFSCQDAGTARVHFSEKTETMMYLGWRTWQLCSLKELQHGQFGLSDASSTEHFVQGTRPVQLEQSASKKQRQHTES